MKNTSSKKVVLVALGATRKRHPFLFNMAYLSCPGMHYINTVLKDDGFETSIINQPNENLSCEEITSRIVERDPDIVLFNQFFSTRQQIKKIISELSGRYIFGVGNHDATFHSLSLSDKDFIEQYSHVDFVWQGEAENGLAAFLRSFVPDKFPVRVNNLENRVRDLDTLPVLEHDDYSGEPGFIVTSRGCFSPGCDFCTTPRFYKDGWRARSPEHVEEELINLKNNGKRIIWAADDNFLGFSESDLERGAKIIDNCKSHGLKLSMLTTVTQIIKAEEKGLLNDFRGALTQVFLGIENGDINALTKIGKRCNINRYRDLCVRAIDALNRNGISVRLGYMNFIPESTFDELKKGATFLYENHMQASTFFHLYNKLNIYEGSKLLDIYQKNGLHNIINNNGEITYEFSDKRIGFLLSFMLMFVVEHTNKLDYLDYEATYLIYMNQLQNKQLGMKYLSIKKQINEDNYSFFLEALSICREDPSIGSLLEILGDFKKRTINSIIEYKKLMPEVIKNSSYILNESLLYIDNISV